jgi:hypothetical protein
VRRGIALKRYDLQIRYWIRKRFYVIFFLVGIIVASVGAVLFYGYANPPSYSYDPHYQGFGVAQNSTALPNIMVIGFIVDPPELFFQYFYIAQTYGTYNFIFVFPFNVVSIIGDSGNMTVNSTNTCTVISMSLHLNESSQQIWGDFRIAKTFLSRNRGLYTIVLPFGRGINSEVFNKIQQKLKVPLSPLADVELYASVPYSYTESIPVITDLNPFINPITNKSYASLHWYFNGDVQNSVTVMCTDQSEIDNIQNMTFWSGIFFGIGFSFILNTVYDAYRTRVEKTAKYD